MQTTHNYGIDTSFHSTYWTPSTEVYAESIRSIRIYCTDFIHDSQGCKPSYACLNSTVGGTRRLDWG